MLFLLDIGLTNAWIYYKKCNDEVCSKYGSRAAFFQAVTEAMVSTATKWSSYNMQSSALVSDESDNNMPMHSLQVH
jgi:hypothetical protein